MTANNSKTATVRHDRNDYGTWRRQWRAEYAELSARIRKMKVDCKEDHRGNGGASYLQESLSTIRKQAAQMMETRTEVDTARKALADKMGLNAPVKKQMAKAA